MTIDEAVKHCLEVAEQNDAQAEKWREEGGEEWGKTTACRECAADHRRLAEWLMELKDLRAEQNDQYVFIHELMSELTEAKRLLKAAVPIINNTFPETGSCWGCANHDEAKDECKGGAFEECSEVCKWEHADEALKLIGEE